MNTPPVDNSIFDLEEKDAAAEKKASKFHLSSNQKWAAFSFIIAFLVVLLFSNAYLQRKALIYHIKQNMLYSLQALSESAWDVAYDDISFNAFPLADLGTIKNIKIYNKYDRRSWTCEYVNFDNSILMPSNFKITLAPKQFLMLDGKPHNLSIPNYQFSFSLSSTAYIQKILFQAYNIAIQDLADIEEFSFAFKTLAPNDVNPNAAFAKSVLELKNIKLNGLLNYPLSQNIKNIFIDSEIVGKIDFSAPFAAALREWLAQDGLVEIKDAQINWPPFLMVGKGTLTLNEKFAPVLRMNTTSKALMPLIEQLEQQKWLDSKGVFVAKILLNNKSYKNDENDEYLTVTTPISVIDNSLLIEKIAVKKFD